MAAVSARGGRSAKPGWAPPLNEARGFHSAARGTLARQQQQRGKVAGRSAASEDDAEEEAPVMDCLLRRSGVPGAVSASSSSATDAAALVMGDMFAPGDADGEAGDRRPLFAQAIATSLAQQRSAWASANAADERLEAAGAARTRADRADDQLEVLSQLESWVQRLNLYMDRLDASGTADAEGCPEGDSKSASSSPLRMQADAALLGGHFGGGGSSSSGGRHKSPPARGAGPGSGSSAAHSGVRHKTDDDPEAADPLSREIISEVAAHLKALLLHDAEA